MLPPNRSLQRWSMDLCAAVRARRGVRLRLHDTADGFARGDVFLFPAGIPARSLLPQFCLFEATGAESLAVASRVSSVPRAGALAEALGLVDADLPGRDWALALGLFAGRRIVFTAQPGTGDIAAARFAASLAVLFGAVRKRLEGGHRAELAHWAEQLGLSSLSQLEARIARPPLLVPVGVTRRRATRPDDVLAALAAREPGGSPADRFRGLVATFDPFGGATEIDVRCDEVLPADAFRGIAARGARRLLEGRMRGPESAFAAAPGTSGGLERAAKALCRHATGALGRSITVNVEQLGAALLMAARAPATVTRAGFATAVYLATKRLQPAQHVHLHRSLADPDVYAPLASGDASLLDWLIDTAAAAGRLLQEGNLLHLKAATVAADPVAMLAGEVAPLPEVGAAIAEAATALTAPAAMTAGQRAALAVDDLRVEHDWDRRVHARPAHRALNALQSATADATPFLLEPARARPLGVLLVHGFLASPAEMRPLAERLADERFPVLGVRLRGHGTSPWDLARRGFEEWVESLEHGYALLRERHARVAVVGFSTGAALALLHAAGAPPGLAGVVACAPPLRFRNPRMRAVPLVHGVNRLLARLTQRPGPLSFRPNRPEHPEVNYRHMPLRGLHELRRLVATLEPNLGAVRCPTLVLQATGDPVVERQGTETLFAALGSAEKSLHWVPSQRHGILRANVGDAHARISEFLRGL